jgi:hypothetical protein
MIGSSPNLRAGMTLQQRAPVSALSGLSRPRYVADATTEGAANNALAQGYQKGNARAAMQSMDKAGFSRGAMDRMKASQQEAAGIAEGASQAAGIRADDQGFNENQRSQWEQMRDQRLNDQYGIQTGMQGANFAKQFAGKQNRWNLRVSQQRASNALRLALLQMMD